MYGDPSSHAAFLERQRRRAEKAVRLQEKAQREARNQQNSQGLECLKKGDITQAIRIFSNIVVMYPTYTQGYFNRGKAYAKNNNFSAAIRDYQQALYLAQSDTYFKRHAELYSYLAAAQDEMRDYNAAINSYTQAITMEPDNWYNYQRRGFAYLATNNLSAAAKDFMYIIQLGHSEEKICNSMLVASKNLIARQPFSRQHSYLSHYQDLLQQISRCSHNPTKFSHDIKWLEERMGGAYAFKMMMLSHTLKQLTKIDLRQLSPLPITYKSRQQYFESFKPLIREDAKANLAQGLELLEQQKLPAATLQVFEFKPAKHPSNLSTLTLKGRLMHDTEIGTSCIALALFYAEEPPLLGLADLQDENDIIITKIIVPTASSTELISFEKFYQSKQPITAYVLGSLITHLRMYEVCTKMPATVFEHEYIDGRLVLMPTRLYDDQALLSQLNPSQRKAVIDFVELPQGLQLLQGPPGTGKTTTCSTLINVLVQKRQKVLICAPSNKAVQVLAKRFIEDFPNVFSVLVGVESKVPTELRSIFIHTWGKDHVDRLEKNVIAPLTKITISEDAILTNSMSQNLKIAYDNFRSIAIELRNLTLFQQIPFAQFENTYLNILRAKILHLRNYELLLKIVKKVSQDLDSASTTRLARDFATILEQTLLTSTQVIFATLSVCGRRLFRDLSVDALIIDEAGQAVEPETLIPFAMQPRKCLLVGDTKQLPATVISQAAADLGYSRSMLWRLLEDCKRPYNIIVEQYRMHPEIRRWPSFQYYNNQLIDGPIITERPKLLPQPALNWLQPCQFVDVRSGKEAPQGHSYCNNAEYQHILAFLHYLKSVHNIDVEQHLGIITFYSGQVNSFTNRLKYIPEFSSVKVNTVDGFQGDERDIIIISFVRSNPHGNIGFLQDFRRLNVAITRARYHLIMFGNRDTLAQGPTDLQSLIRDMENRSLIITDVDFMAKIKRFDKYKATTFNMTQRFEQLAIQESPASSSDTLPPIRPYGYKTQLCNFWQRGNCHKGDKCTYAHGVDELLKQDSTQILS